jgi:hypothetical protein
MKRIERKLFRLTDEIAALKRAETLAAEELTYHEHLNDDTQRDAAVSGSPIDRSDARETASDVARFRRHLDDLRKRRERLEARRQRLLVRLSD